MLMVSDCAFQLGLAELLTPEIEQFGSVTVLKPVPVQFLIGEPITSVGASTVTVPPVLPGASPTSKNLKTTVLPAAPGSTRIRLKVELAASLLAKIGIRPYDATETACEIAG